MIFLSFIFFWLKIGVVFKLKQRNSKIIFGIKNYQNWSRKIVILKINKTTKTNYGKKVTQKAWEENCAKKLWKAFFSALKKKFMNF